MNTTVLIIIASAIVVVIVAYVAMGLFRKRHSRQLRTKFGGAEYDRTLQQGDGRRKAEAGLDQRTDRVESLQHPSAWFGRPSSVCGRVEQSAVSLR